MALEEVHEEIVRKALEGDDFYVILLAKQAALQKVPGSSGTAVFGLRSVAEAVSVGAKEALRSLAAAAVADIRGENVFDEDVGDTYMVDVDSVRPFVSPQELAGECEIGSGDQDEEDIDEDSDDQDWSDEEDDVD
jgi:hypothetical protein